MTTRKRPAWIVCVLAASALLVGGCGTFTNLTDDGGTRIYGGVTRDVDQVLDSYTASNNSAIYFAGLLVWCADVPLSALGDTVTLPYVVPVAMWNETHTRVLPAPILRPSVDDPALK
jgi:uncharacterized protein YceK